MILPISMRPICASLGLAATMLVNGCSDDEENALRADGETVVQVMNFAQSFSLNPLPPGWSHRTFWTRPAMEISFAEKDGVPALRCETNGSGSIFGRHTDISLEQYPILEWSWFIEVPISSELDERTREGDDHPARLYIRLEDSEGDEHALEIIWSNKLFSAGDYKYIGDFPHYVANGGDENIGRWHEEAINLQEIYNHVSARDDDARIRLISIFCDSDDTGGHSVAYFSKVNLISKW